MMSVPRETPSYPRPPGFANPELIDKTRNDGELQEFCVVIARKVGLWCCIGLVALFPGRSATAEPGPNLPPLLTAEGAAKPGTWVRYSVYNRRSRQVSSMRIAALEREGKGQWVEISVTDHNRRTLVFKTLLSGSMARPKGVIRTIVQPPGHQPVEVPTDQARLKLPRMTHRPDPDAKRVGSGKVKVAAGTFTATHYRKRSKKGEVTELWSSTEVPTWPMVKAVTPAVVLELAGYGKGARSQIRGKPGKLDPKLLKQLGGP